jgi:hypothetical protein
MLQTEIKTKSVPLSGCSPDSGPCHKKYIRFQKVLVSSGFKRSSVGSTKNMCLGIPWGSMR